jgi:NAD+ synthase
MHHETTSPLAQALILDPDDAVTRIVRSLRLQLSETLRRKGFVVAMSGGVDSSVCAALAVRAVGADHVLGLFLPERDSDPASRRLATGLADSLGVRCETEDIDPTLEAIGCYRRRNEAVRRAAGEFHDDWKFKLVLERTASVGGLNVTFLVIQPTSGPPRHIRLAPTEYREIVAATNFKQRVRKMIEYFHADRLHYAVLGTPNRLEYDQGFFVKGGDGLADVKPIAHLYKTQVYQLAEYLGLPAEIISRTPTTDTFSLQQTQEEFYYALPLKLLDQLLLAHDSGRPVEAVAEELGLSRDQVEVAYRDIEQKRSTTHSLHVTGLLVQGDGAPQGELS